MRFFSILAICACVFSLSAFAADTSSFEKVVSAGVIRCGYGISPPNLVMDANSKELSGLDYDIWQEIGKELDLKIEWTEEAGWGNFIEGLNTGRYDVFCSQLWSDPGRAEHLTLTQPFLYSFLKTFVRTDDHRFDKSLENLNAAGVTLPAIDGDVSVTMAKNRFPAAKILTLPQTATVSDMFLSVSSGKADALFLDQALFKSLDRENPGALRKITGQKPAFTYGSYYGVKSGEIQLRDMIDVALRNMIDDGRLERMTRKYSQDYVIPAYYRVSP